MGMLRRRFIVLLVIFTASLYLVVKLSSVTSLQHSEYAAGDETIFYQSDLSSTDERFLKENTTKASSGIQDSAISATSKIETPKFAVMSSPEVSKTHKGFEKSWARSAVYGHLDKFVSDRPFFPPCHSKSGWPTFQFEKPRHFLPNTKSPCWYDRTLRCAPYFYVPGVAKGGTTDIYDRLRYHPDIMKGTSKEYHWWERKRYGKLNPDNLAESEGKGQDGVSFSEYLAKVTGKELPLIAQDLKKQGHSEKIFGDGSPSYLWDVHYWYFLEGNQGCLEPRVVVGHHIRHFWPPAKLILTFRHPTPRLYSRFCSRIHRTSVLKKATAEDFHKFVVDGVKKYKACFARWSIRHCAYNVTLFNSVMTRLVEGMYPVFMADWLRIFPREQMFIMRFEDYAADVKGKMQEIFEFLGVAPLNETQMEVIAQTPERNPGSMYDKLGPMLPETAAILNEFYQPFINKFAEILNDKRFLWLDSSHP